MLLAPGIAFAQTGDAGVTFIPGLFQYLDEPPVCCPASGWMTLGSGPRFRMQVDYVRSRLRWEGYGGYPHDELIDGRMASTRRDSLTRETPSLSCARLRCGP